MYASIAHAKTGHKHTGCKYDVAAVKQAAAGRWVEILVSVGVFPADVLDGRNHPCPKCGGTDRFRLIDEQAGALLCNQCFRSGNGDGIAAVQWLLGCDFSTALTKIAEYLGVAPTSGSQGGEHADNLPVVGGYSVTPTTATQQRSMTPAERHAMLAASVEKLATVKKCGGENQPAVFEVFVRPEMERFCSTKPPFCVEGLRRCGGRLRTWCHQRAIALVGRESPTTRMASAVVLYRADGLPWPKTDKLPERKIHTVGGSINSWIFGATPEEIAAATTIVAVEGPSDLIAAVSRGLTSGWVAVSNTGGAGARGKLSCEWAKGKIVIIIGDADKPGQAGARADAVAFSRVGATAVLMGSLPYKVTENHGKDLRDWLNDKPTKTIANLPTTKVTTEDVEAWTNGPASAEITNAVTIGEGDAKITMPLQMAEIVNSVERLTAGELHRIDKNLFVHVMGKPVDWIDSASSLFGWLQSRCGTIRWYRGIGCVGKEELYCELRRRACHQHDAVEIYPHWPTIPTHYYTCPMPNPGDGSALAELIGLHCFETELDRELATALYTTAAWGGPPGSRPAWLITAMAGRGKGKTRFTQNLARTFGGHLDISPHEDIAVIKQRLLSPEAAQKRVATIDNLKTPRFSWGDFENLVTASAINGKRMYIGDASRPNFLTWIITLNGASLSTDMAQRVVEVRLGEPDYDPGWEERVASYIDTNRDRIIADCIGFLQQPAKPISQHSRWATWERAVLSKVDHPDDCLRLILDRRGAVDVEAEESEVIEDYFASKLEWLGYSADRDDVFVPNDTTARWYNAATGDQKKTTGVTRALKQLHDEGRLHRLIQSRDGEHTARGFRWVGEHADAIDTTYYDLRERLAKKIQEQKQPGYFS